MQTPDPHPHRLQEPSSWVIRFSPLIAPGSRVLDVACGHGRHTRLLASRGHRVTAADRDAAALAGLSGVTAVTCVQADLEAAPWPFAPASFDAVIVTNYLHRPLLPHIAASLRGGGILIYETFMAGNERFGKPSNPDYLLRPHELLGAFASLYVVGFEQGVEQSPAPRAVQRIAALAVQPAAALQRTGGAIIGSAAQAAGFGQGDTGPFPLPAAGQID